MKRAPAFQFYPADFLSDENVKLMTNEEVGAYWLLTCHCWLEGSIPDNTADLARLAGTTTERMRDLEARLKPCFAPSKNLHGRLIHPRLEHERKKQATFKKKMSAAGKKGAEARKNRDSSDKR